MYSHPVSGGCEYWCRDKYRTASLCLFFYIPLSPDQASAEACAELVSVLIQYPGQALGFC
jgi:hypothetical protein